MTQLTVGRQNSVLYAGVLLRNARCVTISLRMQRVPINLWHLVCISRPQAVASSSLKNSNVWRCAINYCAIAATDLWKESQRLASAFFAFFMCFLAWESFSIGRRLSISPLHSGMLSCLLAKMLIEFPYRLAAGDLQLSWYNSAP